MTVKVKICGVRTGADARAVAAAGADAIGLNFVPGSPRRLDSLDQARAILCAIRPAPLLAVGVFVNPSLEQLLEAARAVPLDVIQLHGEEPAAWGEELRRRLRPRRDVPLPLWKAFRIATRADVERMVCQAWPADALVLDARVPGGLRGGTGRPFDWGLLSAFLRRAPLVLAGGLDCANVAEAIRRVQPDWVDTASGVEAAPGVKDHAKIKAFVRAAKAVPGAATGWASNLVAEPSTG